MLPRHVALRAIQPREALLTRLRLAKAYHVNARSTPLFSTPVQGRLPALYAPRTYPSLSPLTYSPHFHHGRFASSRPDRPQDPIQSPSSEQPILSNKDAESPWTRESRIPAPGFASNSTKPVEEHPDEYKSKLREGNEDPTAEALEAKKFSELPDLRQGIPMNFSPLDFKSSANASVKAEESESLALNITEDPSRGQGRRDEDGPKEAYISSIERRRLAMYRWMYMAAAGFGIAGFAYLGRDWESDAEANIHPDAPNGLSPIAWYYRFRERLGGQFKHYTEPAFPKLLPDPPTDPAMRMPYTLVLSLEDLLVSSTWTRQDGYKIAKRPGVDYFLRYLCQYYELVIFTTVQMANGDIVLRQLDPYQLCLPIFRDGTRYMNGEHVKDLSYLNRDLSKTIIIDTRAEHVKLHPENAIVLPKWTGKKEDPHTADLVALIPFLEYIAGMELSDVRKVLASYRGKDIPQEFHRREQTAREEFNKRYMDEKSRRGKSGARTIGGLSDRLGFKPQPMMIIPGEQSPMEAFAEGKMLSDQMRERGRRGYLALEQNIKENGEMWLKSRAEDEKKAQEEGMKSMTSGMFGFLPSSSANTSEGKK